MKGIVPGVRLPEVYGRLAVGQLADLVIAGRALVAAILLLPSLAGTASRRRRRRLVLQRKHLAASRLHSIGPPPAYPPGDQGCEQARVRLDVRVTREPAED